MLRRPVKSAGQPLVAPSTFPAPLGGWNARDSLAAMPAKDAIILDNLFPRTTDVSLRGGKSVFATVASGSVRGLLGYTPLTGASALFATTETGIYDISAGGDALVPVTPSTAGEWDSVMFTTAGGNFLWCCNGVDDSRYFDGTAWHILTDVSTPALTGPASASVRSVTAFKSRLLLTIKESLSFWYLPVNSIAGAAVEYPCGELFDRGGTIAKIASWTVDAGAGADDYLCIFTTEGEVAVFQGTNPASTADWSLQGVYSIPRVLGTRCTFKYGGDLCVITRAGVLQMSAALQSSSVDRTSNLSDKISQAFNNYAFTFAAEYGWQGVLFPEQTALLVNIPLGNGHSYQFVMNTITKAWCRFTNWNSEVMANFEGELYTANLNTINKCWDGMSDAGALINAACKTSFNSFGRAGSIKQISMLRPIFTASASLSYSLGIDTDFEDASLSSSASTIAQSVALWDTAVWDSAVWTSGSITVAKWRSIAHKPGRSLALRLRFSAKNVTVTWAATDFIIKPGGFI